MNIPRSIFALVVLALVTLQPAFAQVPEEIIMTESGEVKREKPLDDVVEKRSTFEKRVLPYDPVREADILWEKRIWRVIDIREKLNLPFAYPQRRFFEILMESAKTGEITVYSTDDDKFSTPLTPEEVAAKTSSVDTTLIVDPETYEEKISVVYNDINPEDVKRFRIKEIWYFDKESSMLKVRILGIAPLLDRIDENGEYRGELPLFWVYYPEARKILARERVFNPGNDASPLTWDDIFELRRFSSYIYKASNESDWRLQDYLSGIDLLLEAGKIKQEIFNFEHDLWSY